MRSDTFSLVDEPWIVAVRHDGSTCEVSLREVFARAPELAGLAGEVPTQVFAITRILLAVLYRAVDGPTPEDAADEWLEQWQELWDDWPAVVDATHVYLDRWRDSFDLFHAERPFFQVAGLRTAKDEASDLSKLVFDVPNGEPFLTQRTGRSLARISPGEAARWLVHLHAFDASGIRSGAIGDPRVKSGRGYPIGVGWAGQLGGVMAEGADLRRTLLLNLVAFRLPDLAIEDAGRPAWEREQPWTSASAEPTPRGPLDLYTWQTRRVRLVGDRNGVTGVVLCQGDKILPQNMQRLEPMSAWRYSDPQTKKRKGEVTYMPQEHRPSRAFWRGLASVLPLTPVAPAKGKQQPAPKPPAVVTWLSHLQAARVDLGPGVRLRATGAEYGAQNAVVTDLIDDAVDLAWRLLDPVDERWRAEAVRQVNVTEQGVRELRDLAANVAVAAGCSPRDTDGTRDRAAEQAYGRIDPQFRTWLSGISRHETTADADAEWRGTLHVLLSRLADQIVADAGPRAVVGRDVKGIGDTVRRIDAARARLWFDRKLAQLLPLAPAQPSEGVAS